VLQREPSELEIANAMKIKIESLRAARLAKKAITISAETKVTSDEDDNTYKDLFLLADQLDISSDVMMWKVQFLQALDVLSTTERRAVSWRFGLIDGIPKTLLTTAELMSTTPEGTRKILNSAVQKLRLSSYADILEDGPPQAPITTTNGRLGYKSY
jgi:RNA polymerase primary sigma factor